MADFTFNLAPVPLTDFSEPDVEKSNLWGTIQSRLPFGENLTFNPYDECWRRFEFALWVGDKITGTRQQLPNGDYEYNLTVESSCDDKCGWLEKKCICIPSGETRKSRQGVKTSVGDCSLYMIIRYNKEHDYCPPLKDCSPDWRVEPLPPGCPNTGYAIDITFTLPAGASTADVKDAALVQAFRGMQQLMNEILSRLEGQGKNMRCEGGPEDIEPPRA